MIEYYKEIEKLFMDLEFTNFMEIFKTATYLDDSQEPGSKASSALRFDDLYSDPDDLGYIFFIDKKGNNEEWYIKSICTSVQKETVRNAEGVMVIGKIYAADAATIPHKEEIKKEIMALVRLEELNERLHKAKDYSQNLKSQFRHK